MNRETLGLYSFDVVGVEAGVSSAEASGNIPGKSDR